MGKQIVKAFWCIFLTLPMTANLFNGEVMAENWAVFSEITPRIVVQNFLVIVVVGFAYFRITQAAPFLNWSWFSLFKEEGANIHMIPANIKYFGPVFLVIFALNLPRYAAMEESWFREGTLDWQHGLYLSLIFGLVHCLVGVPLGAGLAISLGGVWFTHQYFVGGTALSTVHHTAYNLVAVSIMFLMLVVKHVNGPRPGQERTPAT